MKNVIILRSVSGAGKSTFASMLCMNRYNWRTVCADDYFEVDGEYKFDVTKLGAAHGDCQRKFLFLLNEDPDAENIVVANTNTKESDFKFYVEAAVKAGANITYLVLENRHGNKDIHNVPDQTLERQEQSLRSSIKLR